MKKLGMLGVALVASILCATPISLDWSPNTLPALSVERADARLGRPLTPMSVADVNRQMDRRTYRQNSVIRTSTTANLTLTTAIRTLTPCIELAFWPDRLADHL